MHIYPQRVQRYTFNIPTPPHPTPTDTVTRSIPHPMCSVASPVCATSHERQHPHPTPPHPDPTPTKRCAGHAKST